MAERIDFFPNQKRKVTIAQMEADLQADVAAMTDEDKAALEASYQPPKRGRRSTTVAN